MGWNSSHWVYWCVPDVNMQAGTNWIFHTFFTHLRFLGNSKRMLHAHVTLEMWMTLSKGHLATLITSFLVICHLNKIQNVSNQSILFQIQNAQLLLYLLLDKSSLSIDYLRSTYSLSYFLQCLVFLVRSNQIEH